MEDMEESRKQIKAFIDSERERAVRLGQILLVGFSQGGAVACNTGLRYHAPLAGIISLSGYIPVPCDEGSAYPEANKSMPILVAHGTRDQVVPLVLADQAIEHMKQQGFSCSYKQYGMEHSICPEEIDDIADFINQLV